MGLIWLLVLAATLAGMWKVFEKAGRQGWEAIVPIYNLYVLTVIVGKPWWWIILLFVPIVGLIVAIFLTHKLSESFGQSVGFTIGLILLPFVFYPLLGFGDSRYQAPQAA